jgi:hypothetical protein
MWFSGMGWFFVILLTVFCGGCASQDTQNIPLAQPVGTTEAIPDETKVVRPEVVEADPAWFACQKDADCKTLKGPCSQPQAVNSHFETDFTVYRDRMNQMIECVENAKTEVMAPPKCLKNRCALNPDQAGKPKL